ncbi:MAG: hypothetical protein K9H49_09125 [Bacteroidales bacterium]|nr:hypothetical protein [Bacteroidales bacterium]MCF8392072.1 hypothetical protein [Bacteroidales bacterium]
MRFFALILFLLLSFGAKAQVDRLIFIEGGTEFPLNYSLGIGAGINNNFQFSIRAGLLTKPYDIIILNTLSALGVDQSITNTVGDAFTRGLTIKGGVNYSFPGFYTGAFYSFYNLNAVDVPTDLINNYFGLDLPLSLFDFIEYKLKSDLHNIGLLIGKSFPVNDRFDIGAEFSVAKTVSSTNSISNIYDKNMVQATGIIHEKMKPLYKKYGYLPSLNIFIRIKL